MKKGNSFKSIGMICGIALVISLTGCKADEEDDVTTDPATTSSVVTGAVTLKSAAFTVGSASSNYQKQNTDIGSPSLDVASDTVALTDFKFCITQIKMTADASADSTSDTTGDAPSGSIEAILGLIDVSDPSADTTWGTLGIPVGFMLSELSVEVHKDPENCSNAEYSLSFNGVQLNQDLEFKYSFNPSIQLDENDILSLALSNIAGTFQAASDAGSLDDVNISTYIEDLIEEGSEE